MRGHWTVIQLQNHSKTIEFEITSFVNRDVLARRQRSCHLSTTHSGGFTLSHSTAERQAGNL